MGERKESMEASELPNLPHEIVLDILLRLPVKSLLRFRCTCKQWCSLISGPQFVSMHLNRALTESPRLVLARKGSREGSFDSLDDETSDDDSIEGPESPRLVLTPKGSQEGSFHSLDYEASDDDAIEEPESPRLVLAPKGSREGFFYSLDYEASDDDAIKDLDYPKKDSKHPHDTIFLGCCNGLLLICSYDSDFFILWNPSTHEYNELLDLLVNLDSYRLFGLGYDSSTDDYKLVMVVHAVLPLGIPPPEGYEYEANDVYVYSFKTKVLTEIQDFPYRIFSDGLATLVDGAPHWIVSCDAGESHFSVINVIIYFDLAEEKFKELEQPNYESKDSRFNLALLGGCLCVVRNYHGSHAEVWAMKEYGVKESWTTLFVISHLPGIEFFDYLTPLCYTKNGEVLMEIDGKKIVVYNPKDNASNEIPISIYQEGFIAATYVESLVSPNCVTKRQHQRHGKGKKRKSWQKW